MQLQRTALVCILACCFSHRGSSFALESLPKDPPPFVVTRPIDSNHILENNHREKKIMSKRIIRSPLFQLKNSYQKSSTTVSSSSFATALVILNAPICKGASPLLRQLWEAASFRVCADGGANRLRLASGDQHIPDVITGDLDSLTAANRAYYEQRGVQILPVIDQDRNDLDKAIAAVLNKFSGNAERIQCVVYGAFGGRFDQEMASMQALYRWQQLAANKMDLFLYDDNTFAFLLPAGETSIELALPNVVEDYKSGGDSSSATTTTNLVAEGPTCGLIPLGGPVESVTTTGLQWNLDHQETKFGELVSTSNRCVESVVTVECSDALIFTAEIHSGVTSSWSEG